MLNTDIADVIASHCDGATGARLSACVTMLNDAIDDWRSGPNAIPDGKLILAAATPRNGLVSCFEAWPDPDSVPVMDKFTPADIASGVMEHIEAGLCNPVILGVSLLLGRERLQCHVRHVWDATRRGRQPVLAFLAERDEGKLSWLSHVLELPPGRVH